MRQLSYCSIGGHADDAPCWLVFRFFRAARALDLVEAADDTILAAEEIDVIVEGKNAAS